MATAANRRPGRESRAGMVPLVAGRSPQLRERGARATRCPRSRRRCHRLGGRGRRGPDPDQRRAGGRRRCRHDPPPRDGRAGRRPGRDPAADAGRDSRRRARPRAAPGDLYADLLRVRRARDRRPARRLRRLGAHHGRRLSAARVVGPVEGRGRRSRGSGTDDPDRGRRPPRRRGDCGPVGRGTRSMVGRDPGRRRRPSGAGRWVGSPMCRPTRRPRSC